MMQALIDLLTDTFRYVITSVTHNFWVLVLGIGIAAAIRVFVDPEKMKKALSGKASISIPGSVAFGALTPFCACGTMAVVLSMFAAMLPWGPVMAFLVSSPLMSPDGFVLMSGVLGVKFAVSLTVASIVMGLGAGLVAEMISRRTKWLDNQLRHALPDEMGVSASVGASNAGKEPGKQGCGCGSGSGNGSRKISGTAFAIDSGIGIGTGTGKDTGAGKNAEGGKTRKKYVLAARNMDDIECGCEGEGILRVQNTSVEDPVPMAPAGKLREMLDVIVDLGLKQILPMFMVFAGIGYLINRFIPAAWIQMLFGADKWYSIPLAALIGLPMYVSGDGSIPLIRSLLDSGAGAGAIMAFMITGPGTSAGVIAGIGTILKGRAILLYISLILVGGILSGYIYQLL